MLVGVITMAHDEPDDVAHHAGGATVDARDGGHRGGRGHGPHRLSR